jgi:hypothetical protein
METERNRQLDLLADYIMRKMGPLCGEAVQENMNRYDVLDVCGIDRKPYDHEGDPLNLEQLHYAGGLLGDVFRHMATRWGQFRETERRLRSAAAPTYDDEGEFD